MTDIATHAYNWIIEHTSAIHNLLGDATRTATKVVAASDASDAAIDRADYVCDGTADNVQIQLAIDALPTGGGKVELSEGTFVLAAQLYRDIANVTIQGQGWNTILKRADDTVFADVYTPDSAAILKLVNDGWIVKDLAIDGNESNNRTDTEGMGVQVYGGSGNIIENIYAHDCIRDPFNVAWRYGSTYALRNKIVNCVAENSYADHLYYISGGSDNLISGCIGKGYWTGEAYKISEDTASGDDRLAERNCIQNCQLVEATINPRGIAFQIGAINLLGKTGPDSLSKGNKILGCFFDTEALGVVRPSLIVLPETEIGNCFFNQGYVEFHGATPFYSELHDSIIRVMNDTAATTYVVRVISDKIKIHDNTFFAEMTAAGGVRIIAITEDRVDLNIQGNEIIQVGANGVSGFHLSGTSPSLDTSIIKNNKFVNVDDPFINFTGANTGAVAFDRNLTSIALDLTGATTDIEVFDATTPAILVGYTILYSVATGAGGGVNIRVGMYNVGAALDDDYYDVSTSEASKAKGYSKDYYITELTQSVIAAGDTITVGTAGGKADTGEVILILQIAEMAD